MKTHLLSALLFTTALFLSLPGKAQLAYNRVVMPEDIMLTANIDRPAPSKEGTMVYGTVQGMNGVLPGATVWLNGGNIVAVANAEGVFALPVPAGTTQVEVTCSYAGLQEEVVTLPVDEPGQVYLLRTRTPQGKHFVTDSSLKNRYDSLVKKVRSTGSHK